ncbi:hypothetical protein [Halomonas denitrificans]|nr:hypothetical protein [Halomonas denitrificans]
MPNPPSTARPERVEPSPAASARLHPVLASLLNTGSGARAVEAPILSAAAHRWLEWLRLGRGETTRRVVAAYEASGGVLERRAPGAPGLSRSEAALLAAFEAAYQDRPLATEDALARALGRPPGETLVALMMADGLAHRVRCGHHAAGRRIAANH